jgi:hypothetical protein
MNQTDARVKAYITAILKKNKSLTEREVKAAVGKGLKLGRKPIGTGVIRQVRRSLGIDRPRAISYARNLLAKYPTLEAKKVIEDVGKKFGISLQPPDVSRLRPGRKKVPARLRGARARKKKVAAAKVEAHPVRKSQRSPETVSGTHKAKGTPEEVARFFRSLAQ